MELWLTDLERTPHNIPEGERGTYKDCIKSIRKAYRSMMSVMPSFKCCNHVCVLGMYNAFFVRVALLFFMYTAPWVYFPYRGPARGEQGFRVLHGFLLAGVGLFYYIVYFMAKDLTRVYGKGWFQLDIQNLFDIQRLDGKGEPKPHHCCVNIRLPCGGREADHPPPPDQGVNTGSQQEQ